MATRRYYNLPDEKRNRILTAALEEYGERGVDGARVSGIVRRAGIPRGSFYQYFADMDDLLAEVFEHVTAEKMRFMAGALRQAGQVPFADYVELTFDAGLDFAARHPRIVALGKALYSTANQTAQALVAEARQMGIEHYRVLVETDQAAGRLRPDVDARVLATFVMTVFSDVIGAMLLNQAGGKYDRSAIAQTLFAVLREGIQVREEVA